jgi:hypothetical protein
MKHLSVLVVLAAEVTASALWAAAPKSLYTDKKNGTVQDNKTGLVWQQQAQWGTEGYRWVSAMAYCSSLNLGGFSTGWRLPTKLELESLVDPRIAPPGPTIDRTVFPDTNGDRFWTSTPAHDDGLGYLVNFFDGYSSVCLGDFKGWARCVH